VRRVTPRFAVGLGLLVVALLALDAAPSTLGSGGPHRLVVTGVESETPAANASDLPERRSPYLTEALRASDGRSSGDRTTRLGLKGPFDEVAALVARTPGAAVEGRDHAVRVTVDGQCYRAEGRR
jgi:hypothetical protein